ncbi:MAG TPA: M23 family metallopeptidase [Methylomirabilota bacterium]|nr:M23 family metallopeptidase [Methylomirabilota bacterium]
MARSRVKLWFILLAVPSVLVVAVISLLAWRQSVPGVRAELAPTPRWIGLRTPLTVDLHAARGGVRVVEIRLVQGAAKVVLARQNFSGTVANDQRVQLVVAGNTLGLREGGATLEIRASDGFWRPIRVDDRPILSTPVTLDLTPPSLEVLAATRYLHQGGGGLVALRSKGGSRVGVGVGELFFPAYPVGATDSGLAVALFALPWNVPVASPISVLAQDEAGNSVSRALQVEIKPRRFPSDTVELSDQFFASKLPELLPERGAIPPEQYVQAFLTVNREKRRAADEIKRQVALRTTSRPLWEGPFLQPRNTKVFSNFAEARSYRYHGQELDTGLHMGYDLASVKHSAVPAANAGVVVFTGPLTIYGNTVIVDHGLGLQTLYAHLSAIEAKDGEHVSKGQELGRTGATGLAVGDHLHYEVLIHGISVTPIEWWDARWIRDHVGRPLREANIPLLQTEHPGPEAEEQPGGVARRRRAPGAR